ncbi:MAG: hypothetical protein IH845_05025, partial [Nanoarchaeota archaeon]|nr:hypothetical protein [Nanoarchaeota archaeon]
MKIQILDKAKKKKADLSGVESKEKQTEIDRLNVELDSLHQGIEGELTGMPQPAIPKEPLRAEAEQVEPDTILEGFE